MKQKLDAIFVLAMFICAVWYIISHPPISLSGAMKTLRTNGEMEQTISHDTLYYTYWNQLTKRELEALRALSKHYVVITKEYKDDTLK